MSELVASFPAPSRMGLSRERRLVVTHLLSDLQGRSISAPYHSRLAKTSATSGKKTKTGVACSGGPGRDSNEGPAGLLKSDVGADDEQQPQSSDTQQAPAAQGEEKGDLVKPKPEE